MNDIEFLMSFAAILFGLLLANVANNMADAVRARRDLPIGFTPWAISLYISASAIFSYGLYYNGSELYEFDMVSLTLLLGAVLPYVFVSRLLYPEHKEKWGSVEDYYIANRHVILGVMAASPLISAGSFFYSVTDLPLLELAFNIVFVVHGPPLAMMILLMLTEKPKWHWAGWGFLIVHRIAMMVWLAVETG